MLFRLSVHWFEQRGYFCAVQIRLSWYQWSKIADQSFINIRWKNTELSLVLLMVLAHSFLRNKESHWMLLPVSAFHCYSLTSRPRAGINWPWRKWYILFYFCRHESIDIKKPVFYVGILLILNHLIGIKETKRNWHLLKILATTKIVTLHVWQFEQLRG